jgi:glucose 1-dehydrogenase
MAQTDQKNVVITGAAGGVGRASVELFREKGWRVFAVDVRKPDPEFSDSISYLQADISVADQVELLCKTITAQTVGIDALINNAAVQITKSLADTAVEEWDAVHAVNLRAPYLLAKNLFSALSRVTGTIVNVSSVHALATSANIGAYASTKGGLLALTRAMAIEFAPQGIRVNVILPGATDTPMLDAGMNRGHVKGADANARKQDLADKILLKRLAKPAEIASAIYFLADNEQSAYITGQSLVVDGGATARLSTE